MVPQVIWSRTALRQLREIKDYIAADNPTAADKVAHEIEDRADLLQTMPFGFPAYAPRLDENTRHTVVGRYRIFYRVVPDQNQVRILKVWHSSRRDPRLPRN